VPVKPAAPVAAKPAVPVKPAAPVAAKPAVPVKPAAPVAAKPAAAAPANTTPRTSSAVVKQSGAKRVVQAEKLAVLVKAIAKKHKLAMLHFTKAEKLGQVLLSRIQKFQLWVQKGINF
jgi:hypothetical protein